MEATFRLGKLVSKYIILDIIGYAAHREEGGELLMATSRMHRTLL
jgi:hypothetical protein